MKKKIYGVWLNTQYGVGLQYVKANNQEEAKSKFKKRFPKKIILDVGIVEDNYNHRSRAI